MELPSAEDYPDYYEVIERPVSMGQIKRKKYGTPAEFKQDFVTMFENAKEYNEATSQMYPKKEIPKKPPPQQTLTQCSKTLSIHNLTLSLW